MREFKERLHKTFPDVNEKLLYYLIDYTLKEEYPQLNDKTQIILKEKPVVYFFEEENNFNYFKIENDPNALFERKKGFFPYLQRIWGEIIFCDKSKNNGYKIVPKPLHVRKKELWFKEFFYYSDYKFMILVCIYHPIDDILFVYSCEEKDLN